MLYVEFNESYFPPPVWQGVPTACKICWDDCGCFHNHTHQGACCALLRSRKGQEKKPDKGGESHFASYSWESLFNVHPPKFSLLSREVLVKNIDAIVSPNNSPQIRLCLHAFGDNHSPRKCCWIIAPNCINSVAFTQTVPRMTERGGRVT